MLNRSVFFKINKAKIVNIHDAIIAKEYIEIYICYIVKRKLIDSAYIEINGTSLDIRFRYDKYKIDNVGIYETYNKNTSELLNTILPLPVSVEKDIEQTIDEFYMYVITSVPNFKLMHTLTLNIDCMLLNNDTLLITYEVFNNGTGE